MSYKINTFITSDSDVVSRETRLSICITSNGFSFALFTLADDLVSFGEVETDMSATMASLMTDIKSVFDKCRIYPLGLRESELIVPATQFVWVPQHLYDPTNQLAYLEAIFGAATGKTIFCELNDNLRSYAVFTANNNVVSAFKVAVPHLKIRCQHSKMVNDDVLAGSELKSLLLVNMRQGETDYAVMCNRKLQISTVYDCPEFDDTLYHAVNITKQLHLEEAPLSVAVCGDVDRERFMRFGSFFSDVVLYTGRRHSLLSPEMQHVPLYRHAVLMS